jgi:hypothetical protein
MDNRGWSLTSERGLFVYNYHKPPSPDAVQILYDARSEAAERGYEKVGTGLLGIALARSEPQRPFLETLGINPIKFADAINFIIPPTGGNNIPAEKIDHSDSLRGALGVATYESQEDNSPEVTPKHLLLGLTLAVKSIPAEVLAILEITPEKIRRIRVF